MIVPADVLKIKCKFVKDLANYFTAKKYFIDADDTQSICSYLSLLQAENESCVDDDTACKLRELATSYKDAACTSSTTTPCDAQVDITLTVNNTSACIYTGSLYNSTGTSQLMKFSLGINTDEITGTILSKALSTCGPTGLSDIFTNQLSYTDRAKGNTRVGIGSKFNGVLSATSYITTLRVYETDEFGILQNTPIDLDLDPETSDYYGPSGPFPDLASVTPSDLQFGSSTAVFTEAFETLMDNVSLVRYGVTGKHKLRGWLQTQGGSTYINVASSPVNLPASYLFGMNRNDLYMKVNVDGTSYTTTGPVAFLTPSSVINGTSNFTVPCGTVTLNIPTTSITTPLDYAQTSFNKIVLQSNFSSQAVPFTTNSVSCANTTLLATYDDTNVDSVEWRNRFDDVITTLDTVTVSSAGTYTFYVTTNNGCIINKSITI